MILKYVMLKIHLKAVLYKLENGTHCFLFYWTPNFKVDSEFLEKFDSFLEKICKESKKQNQFYSFRS